MLHLRLVSKKYMYILVPKCFYFNPGASQKLSLNDLKCMYIIFYHRLGPILNTTRHYNCSLVEKKARKF